jgi:hypothetical protein
VFFIDCAGEDCESSIDGFSPRLDEWQRTEPIKGGMFVWFCPKCRDGKLGLDRKFIFSDEPAPAVSAKLLQEARGHLGRAVDLRARAMERQERRLSTSDERTVGFDRPENGSGERYTERRKGRPWASHTLWWVIHNVVAHPLIGLLPFRPLFRFHDWTSERMHGV